MLNRFASLSRKSMFESLETRTLLAADVLISDQPTAGAPGYTTFFFTIESDEPVTGINAVLESTQMRQVNPAGADTIFRDNNAGFAQLGEGVYADSQFQFSTVNDNLTVDSSNESNTELRADFTGFTPFTNRTVAHVAVANAGSSTYSFELTTASGTETIEGTLHSPLADVVGRNGNQWYLARSNGTQFATGVWGEADPAIEWLEPGDVNGDGADDLVGWNPTTGEWTVALTTEQGALQEFWGQWSTAAKWVDVSLADINGDGRDDIVGRVETNGIWWAAISTGESFVNERQGQWSAAVTWVDVRKGDVTGDGRADIVGRVESNGSIWVAISSETGLDSFRWGRWRTDVNWGFVELGDANGDGREDLIGRNYDNGVWLIGISTGSTFVADFWGKWTKGLDWVDIQLADLNGDGRVDIVGRLGNSGYWWVAESQGDGFIHNRRGMWSTRATWVDVQIGDVNGDGRDDIIGRSKRSGKWWASLSNGTSLQNQYWGRWDRSVFWEDVLSGDF